MEKLQFAKWNLEEVELNDLEKINGGKGGGIMTWVSLVLSELEDLQKGWDKARSEK